MKRFRTYLLCAALLLACLAIGNAPRVEASGGVPACELVATAAQVEVYYCAELKLFVNQYGFMLPGDY